MCYACTQENSPPPKYEEIQETISQGSAEDNMSTIEELKKKEEKLKEEHNGTTPMPGMVE